MRYINIIIFFVYALNTLSFSQACCSSGTPIVGSLTLPPANDGQLSIALSYNINNLNDLYAGDQNLNDDSRLRQSSAIIFETSYGLSEYFAINTLFTYVTQERSIQSIVSGQDDNFIKATGLGDAAGMLTYKIIRNTILSPARLDIGFGVKAPLGDSDLAFQDILLPVDLQPGTGSWDILMRANYFYSFKPMSGLDLFATTTLRLNGENSQNFKVGDELLLFGGGAYRLTDNLRFIAQLNFRYADLNQQTGEAVAGTGGTWWYFMPGIEVFIAENLGTRASGAIPIYQDLNGVQLTTTFAFTMSIFYFFN